MRSGDSCPGTRAEDSEKLAGKALADAQEEILKVKARMGGGAPKQEVPVFLYKKARIRACCFCQPYSFFHLQGLGCYDIGGPVTLGAHSPICWKVGFS